MISRATDSQEEFKDYCLILQVHPEADAGMIEAAKTYHAALERLDSGDSSPDGGRP